MHARLECAGQFSFPIQSALPRLDKHHFFPPSRTLRLGLVSIAQRDPRRGKKFTKKLRQGAVSLPCIGRRRRGVPLPRLAVAWKNRIEKSVATRFVGQG